MNNKQTEKGVRRGFVNATPDNLTEIKADCQATSPVRRAAVRPNYWRFATCALALVLMIVGVFGIVGLSNQNALTASAATVSMDVNPSLEIKVNKDNKVIEVVARNEEAQSVIHGLDFNGCSLDVCVYALVGAMYSKGYLSEMSNSVLVDVETNGTNKDSLEQIVQSQITEALKNNNVMPNVIVSQGSDNADENRQATEIATTYQLTIAKARLVTQILRNAPEGKYNVEQLVKLKVNDLALILSGVAGGDVGSGTISSGSYIGADAALEAVKAELGLSFGDEVKVEIKLDYEDGRMVYEVEFVHGNFRYECEVVAAKAAADSGKVFDLEIKSTAQKATRSDNLTQEQIEELKKNVKKEALRLAGVSLFDQSDVVVTFDDIDNDDDEIELRFSYDGTEYEFEFDFAGNLVKWEKKADETVEVDIDISDRLNVIIRDKLLFLNLGDIQLKWEMDEQKGTVVEYKAKYVSPLTDLEYEFEIKIDTLTGAVIKIDYEIDRVND